MLTDARECETCKGIGTIDMRLGGEWNSDPKSECPDCEGIGRIATRAIGSEVRAESVCPAPSCDECNERGACATEETLTEREEVRTEAQPVAWFAFADSNGPVPLELWGFDKKECKHAVLESARSVGWKGTIEGYLLHMRWAIRPLFLSPTPMIPEGMALVPNKLTVNQRDILADAFCRGQNGECVLFDDVWRSILAAAQGEK